MLDLRDVRKAYGGRVVFGGVNVHIERGDRIALIGPNGAGKSTLMRMLSGVEAPDSGTRTEGHQVVMQYFAQDEATRLDPTLNIYQTLAGDAPIHMVPSIRNILGGFLFSGDDVEKPVRVLSGGERTRLAVARMLLRPSNTLLLDEPTNHLDLDSKDVLLEALEDFGGTLIFVSHDRYFVDKLATKVINIGGGEALLVSGQLRGVPLEPQATGVRGRQPRRKPGTKAKRRRPERRRGKGAPPHGPAAHPRMPAAAAARSAPRPRPPAARSPASGQGARLRHSYEERKRDEAEARRLRKAADARQKRIDDLESAHRRTRAGHPRSRSHDVGARVLRQPRNRKADYRQAPGADVGGRRPDAPVGGAARRQNRNRSPDL